MPIATDVHGSACRDDSLTTTSTDNDDELSTARAEIAALKATIEGQLTEITALKATSAGQPTENTENTEITALKATIEGQQATIEGQLTENTALKATIDRQHTDNTATITALRTRVASLEVSHVARMSFFHLFFFTSVPPQSLAFFIGRHLLSYSLFSIVLLATVQYSLRQP